MKEYKGGLKEEKLLKEQHIKVQEEINELPKERRDVIHAISDRVQKELDIQTDLVLDFSHEDRIRKAGYVPSQAEEIAELSKNYAVGQIFKFRDELKVLTPFKTIVDAQVYLNVLQDRVISLSKDADNANETIIEILTEVSEKTTKRKSNGK